MLTYLQHKSCNYNLTIPSPAKIGSDFLTLLISETASRNLFEAKEVQRRTLIAIIEDDELLAQAIAEAERVV